MSDSPGRIQPLTVGRLWQHAVKSMQGEAVDEVLLGPGGLVGDRAYGFVDVETERLVSAKHPKRYAPVLACHAVFAYPPTLDAPTPPVSVTFPDGTTVDGDQDEIARRLSALLGREVRMVSSIAPGVPYEEVWPELEGFGPDALADALQVTAAEEDEAGERIVAIPTGIATPGTLLDLSPLHILATSTLAALAKEHPDGAWDERRFRANIVFDDGDGSNGQGEDGWLGCDLVIGEQARIQIVAPTPRCIMVTLAQDAFARDHEILRTLARVNRRQLGGLGQFACAGSYAEVVTPGVVRTGDEVRIEPSEPRESAVANAVVLLGEAMKNRA